MAESHIKKDGGKDVRPIIIRRKKVVEGGHHGGAWKVAYADFVTALMAFFLVMWLVASANDQQKTAIFDYFKNPSMVRGAAPMPAPGQDGPGGASTSPIDLRGGLSASAPAMIAEAGSGAPKADGTDTVLRSTAGAEASDEQQRFEQIRDELQKAIDANINLQRFKNQLLVDITSEGLRIQIVDDQNRPMFDLSGTTMKSYTRELLLAVGQSLVQVPNRISISGHTDDTPYIGGDRSRYTNWELSADRANAARRVLVEGGVPVDKVARVVGMSSYAMFDAENPSNPMNRRISIIVLNKATEESLMRSDRFNVKPASGPPATPAPTAPR
ncbi:MAG: flagellar motor protein MotB [Gammaproteobacteria bacterium]|nr:flagellar motor protein MotB [Gammaproteobacteria bacterium]